MEGIKRIKDYLYAIDKQGNVYSFYKVGNIYYDFYFGSGF
jgi:hypothetical protein